MSEMNCSQAREQIASYHDGELELAASLAVETHLSTCAACRDELAQLQALSKRIREQAPYHRAPSTLQLRLPEEVSGPQSAPRARASAIKSRSGGTGVSSTLSLMVAIGSAVSGFSR